MNVKVWDLRVERFRNYLNHLYYSGRLCLNDLNSFRSVVDQICGMMNVLIARMPLVGTNAAVEKDMARLLSEFTLLEYNVSLLSTHKSAVA